MKLGIERNLSCHDAWKFLKTSTEISISFQSFVCCSNQIIACISVSRCIILSVFDWNFESVQCNRQNRSPLLALD